MIADILTAQRVDELGNISSRGYSSAKLALQIISKQNEENIIIENNNNNIYKYKRPYEACR